jgi:CheY-like chemotaxis protein
MAKILVVDDDDLLRSLLREWGHAAGHRVFEAVNGNAGIAAFEEHHPDMVITDIFMPDSEGLGMIRKLRKQHPHVKIIAMSSGSDKVQADFLHVAKEMGAVATLYKPFTVDELSAAVAKVLGSAHSS